MYSEDRLHFDGSTNEAGEVGYREVEDASIHTREERHRERVGARIDTERAAGGAERVERQLDRCLTDQQGGGHGVRRVRWSTTHLATPPRSGFVSTLKTAGFALEQPGAGSAT